MSEYRYAGESIGKKLARANFWVRAKEWLGTRFYEELHLILASNEGGDISVLKGLGVPAANIFAAEIDEDAATRCRDKHQDVTVFSGDVVDAAAQIGRDRKVCCAFLDFCGWGGERDLRTISSVATSCLRDESVLAYAFMRGREPKRIANELASSRCKEDTLQRRRLAQMSHAGFKLREGDRLAPVDGRSMRWFDAIADDFLEHNMFPMTLCKLHYHSTCSWRAGVPMLICGKWIIKGRKHGTKKSFEKHLRRFGRPLLDYIQRIETEYILGGGGIRSIGDYESLILNGSTLCVAVGERRLRLPLGEMFDRDFTAVDHLVRVANNLEHEHPGRAHMILNISKTRLAAFKAHVTMGTYKKAG